MLRAIPLNGLHKNWNRTTKIFHVKTYDDTLQALTVVSNTTVEVIDNFIYLGFKIVKSCLKIRNRLDLARSPFGRLVLSGEEELSANLTQALIS